LIVGTPHTGPKLHTNNGRDGKADLAAHRHLATASTAFVGMQPCLAPGVPTNKLKS